MGGGDGGPPSSTPVAAMRIPSGDRAEDLIEKFRVLLASPLADGVARIIEESFRLLPIIPPPTAGGQLGIRTGE